MLNWLLKAAGAEEHQEPSAFDWFLKVAGAQDLQAARGTKACCVVPNRSQFFWGMCNVPVDAAVTHFVVIGAPGSGKTVSIQLFLQSIAHRFMTPTPDVVPERLIIFDPKRDILSFLAALGLQGDSVSILNPFDERSMAWDLASDINSEALAQQFAALLIAEEKQSSAPFFWQSSRVVVEAVILGLMATKPGKWTLRDLLNVLATKERIEAITARTPGAKLKADRFIQDRAHFPAILSSIASKVGKFEVIATLWHNTTNGKTFSVKKWLEGHGVLVLGNHPNFRESITPINSLLLQVLSGHLLTGPEVKSPRTWVVLDEFRWMEQVECIRELLNQGRSKGVSVLLGIQDIEGLKVVYGDHGANELLGQCANKSFLRIGSYPTAEWAEKHFAPKEEMETKTSIARGETTTTTESHDKVTRPLFMQGQFSGLPDPKTGIFAGIHDIPRLGGAIATKEWSQAVFDMVKSPINDVPNEQPRDVAHQQFSVWSAEEAAVFLGTSPETEQQKGKQPQKAHDESQFAGLMKINRKDLFGH